MAAKHKRTQAQDIAAARVLLARQQPKLVKQRQKLNRAEAALKAAQAARDLANTELQSVIESFRVLGEVLKAIEDVPEETS